MSIKEKYAGKILAVRLYESDRQEFFADDFSNIDLLEPILDEMIVNESDITPAGKSFLEEFYDLKELSQKLFERDNLVEIYPKQKSAHEIEELIRGFEPMMVNRFIETSRGLIDENSTLKENFLPPK